MLLLLFCLCHQDNGTFLSQLSTLFSVDYSYIWLHIQLTKVWLFVCFFIRYIWKLLLIKWCGKSIKIHNFYLRTYIHIFLYFKEKLNSYLMKYEWYGINFIMIIGITNNWPENKKLIWCVLNTKLKVLEI